MKNKNPGIAAVLSFIIPGLGQIYCERIGRGIAFLVAAIIGYMIFVVPGLIVALVATFDALNLAKSINGETEAKKL
ncbi:MAG: hypothetical protein Q8R55_00365 [Candidatus Taylorbacteria bacterium]|nr:hypothetical protein [Candidatus Taylorbacteria bacterium]